MSDMIDNPEHYQVFPDYEAIEMICEILTEEEYIGYLKGNVLKYRLRAGKKDAAEADIAKALKYEQWLRENVKR